MRIYMQIPPGDAGPPRFYHLHLQEDLIDGWTLVREWGYQGAGGRMIRDHYTDREQAEEAMMSIRDAQLKKGYQVVFMQAQT
ncbi:putative DNA-binding WGR domain protein [Thiogranum longum]|uniref:Putative DNA-binding WGR domain protein n=1 Tax=Thiogranum longum TaxID=1537524 RepID=A0A4R1HA55_9GAMM|nr:WGR domain-containing protein [Thiogranum longum]TCK17010.1 putative DNA-binding WGR domain protein [Thiogranum longum]